MDKDEFLRQFQDLNNNLEGALASQDFDRAMRIDTVRRNMLHEFAAKTVPDGDRAFFETLEHCAAENAKAITQLSSEMTVFQRQARKNLRGLSGYRS